MRRALKRGSGVNAGLFFLLRLCGFPACWLLLFSLRAAFFLASAVIGRAPGALRSVDASAARPSLS